jgi:hypothetical protein
VVRAGYSDVGRLDAYRSDQVRYITTEQFAYVAAVNGIMLRERPAANLFLGAFFAESLLLAETGHETGAIQIAGTANIHQLPFFVVACDYTLIGEEYYAASAYLSKDPRFGVQGADTLKMLTIAAIVIAVAPRSGVLSWRVVRDPMRGLVKRVSSDLDGEGIRPSGFSCRTRVRGIYDDIQQWVIIVAFTRSRI